MKKYLGNVSAIAAMLGYVVIIVQLLSTDIRASFATFALYFILGVISLISLVLQKGNYKLLLGIVAGSGATTVLLIFRGSFAWTTLDTVISALVLVCLIVWKIQGARAAVIASTIAICLAGVPTAVQFWQHPQAAAAPPWILWFTASMLSFFARKSWKLEEWFFQAMTAIAAAVMVILSIRSW